MSILAFPSSPSVNDLYQKGEFVWRWDGVRWRALRSFSTAQSSDLETALNSVLADVEDALQFKGTLGASGTDSALPTTHGIGWTFKVVDAGTYAGKVAEIGDMIVSVVARTGSNNADADWAVIQKNIDFSSFVYDIIPAQDETISIGSATKKFNELYLSGNTIYIGNKTISVTPDGEIAFPAGTPLRLGDNLIDVDATSGDIVFSAKDAQGQSVNRGFRIGNIRLGDENGSFAITNAITNNVAGLSSLGAIRQNLFSVNHTLDMDDAGSVVEITSASNLTITVPADSTTNFPVGTEIALLRLGTGTITVAPAAGVTLLSDTNKRKIKVQYTGAALRKLSANNWILIGNLEA